MILAALLARWACCRRSRNVTVDNINAALVPAGGGAPESELDATRRATAAERRATEAERRAAQQRAQAMARTPQTFATLQALAARNEAAMRAEQTRQQASAYQAQ